MGKLVEHYAHCNSTPVDIQPYTHHSAISDAVTDSVGSDHSRAPYQARSRPHPESWQFDPWNSDVQES